MAHILYALSGQGRGHTSRVLAVAAGLRARGHTVTFCGGGTARDVLAAEGERVIPAPTLHQPMQANRLHLRRTAAANWRTVLGARGVVARLAATLAREHSDLLITDFDVFAHRAARHIGLPVVSFDHQQVITETLYDPPGGHAGSALVARIAIRLIRPRDPVATLITTFAEAPLRRPERVTRVPPILRADVRALRPHREGPVLVYYNEATGADAVVAALGTVDAPFVLYNFGTGPAAPNLRFEPPSRSRFLADLARCRAVICTAGYTLLSEALYLGKPVLAVPNGGIFEQSLNAAFLVRSGYGHAVEGRPPTAADVRAFLDEADRIAPRLDGAVEAGNEQAVDAIEAVLRRLAGRGAPRLP